VNCVVSLLEAVEQPNAGRSGQQSDIAKERRKTWWGSAGSFYTLRRVLKLSVVMLSHLSSTQGSLAQRFI